jgi:ABC-2 type transport system ATP-binding protein
VTGAVDVEDLTVSFGPKVAVNGLSFTVEAGTVFGLLGPNGAGKTTTVETLEGYRQPAGGSVRVLGLDPLRQRAELAPRIGVMLQDGGIYPGIRPLEALRLFAAYYDNPEDPDRLLDLVGLRDAQRTMVRRLSGGQKQRLSLALALIGRPEVAFLDEPTAGMDPHARHTTWDIVEGLRERGVTVLLTTHAMDEAERLCDRVAIIDQGRLLAIGSPADLTGTGATETRFSARPGLDLAALAAALGVDAAALSEGPAGEYTIRVASTPALVAALTGWMADHDVTLGDLRAGRRTLEDVFLSLTRGEGPR